MAMHRIVRRPHTRFRARSEAGCARPKLVVFCAWRAPGLCVDFGAGRSFSGLPATGQAVSVYGSTRGWPVSRFTCAGADMS